MTPELDNSEGKIEFTSLEGAERTGQSLDEHEKIQFDPNLPNRETPERSKIYSIGERLEESGSSYKHDDIYMDGLVQAGGVIGGISGMAPIMAAGTEGAMLIDLMSGFSGAVVGGAGGAMARAGLMKSEQAVGEYLQNTSSNIDQGTEYDAQQIKDELNGLEDPNFTVREGGQDRRIATTDEVYGFLDSLEDPSSDLEVEEYAVTELDSGDIAVGIRASEYDGDEPVEEKEVGIFAETPYEGMNRSLADSVSEIPDDFSNYNGHR